MLFVADCVNVPQRSYSSVYAIRTQAQLAAICLGCAFGAFPCQFQKALVHCTNSFNQRLLIIVLPGTNKKLELRNNGLMKNLDLCNNRLVKNLDLCNR